MGKYAPLYDQLIREDKGKSQVLVTLSALETIIGSKLPTSAYKYQSWWGNDRSHFQSESWMSAGFKVENTKEPIETGCVTFVRDNFYI